MCVCVCVYPGPVEGQSCPGRLETKHNISHVAYHSIAYYDSIPQNITQHSIINSTTTHSQCTTLHRRAGGRSTRPWTTRRAASPTPRPRPAARRCCDCYDYSSVAASSCFIVTLFLYVYRDYYACQY